MEWKRFIHLLISNSSESIFKVRGFSKTFFTSIYCPYCLVKKVALSPHTLNFVIWYSNISKTLAEITRVN